MRMEAAWAHRGSEGSCNPSMLAKIRIEGQFDSLSAELGSMQWKSWFVALMLASLVGKQSTSTDQQAMHFYADIGGDEPHVLMVAVLPDLGVLHLQSGEILGLESELIMAFAQKEGMVIEWVCVHSANAALKALRQGRVDVAIGGLPEQYLDGLARTSRIRTCAWHVASHADSVYILNNAPTYAGLWQQDSITILTHQTNMYRFSTDSLLMRPDFLINQPLDSLLLIGQGGISWYSSPSDSSLQQALTAYLSSPLARRNKAIFRHHGMGNGVDITGMDSLFHGHTIDPYTLMALAYTESRFNASIISSAGAVGLMQVLPNTAYRLGTDTSKLLNPLVNIEASLAYLKFLDRYWERFGVAKDERLPFVLASYNTGPTPVRRQALKAEKKGYLATVWKGHVDQFARGPGAFYQRRIMRRAKLYRSYAMVMKANLTAIKIGNR